MRTKYRNAIFNIRLCCCSWGIDYLKVDNCAGSKHPQQNTTWILFKQVRLMGGRLDFAALRYYQVVVSVHFDFRHLYLLQGIATCVAGGGRPIIESVESCNAVPPNGCSGKPCSSWIT